MKRYFVKLAYDGTNYHGWQSQENAQTIQQELEEKMSTLLKYPIKLTGCGRTDTGVHATNYYAHFDIAEAQTVNQHELTTKLNSFLNPAIVVHEIISVRKDAHARFDAVSRLYEYHIHIGKHPFIGTYSMEIPFQPDVLLMNRASEILMQTQDFASFCKAGGDNNSTLCHVRYALWQQHNHRLCFTIEANRFLRNMVRSIVGTCLDVGYGKMSLKAFKDAIAERSRCATGTSVPAKGLFLENIIYPPDVYVSNK